MQRYRETICAPVHQPGSAITIIRISGDRAIGIADSVFVPSGGVKGLKEMGGYSLLHGEIVSKGEFIDEVLLSVFRSPRSYTGEDMVEISCHGSWYVQSTIMQLLIEAGASAAHPGEFTRRAFMNGKIDLLQAEAVADLIASEAEAAHRLAATQLKGGYSREISSLRKALLELTSLLELELDFGEEDVEFADRKKLLELTKMIGSYASSMALTFAAGNAIKKGIPVAIAGRPNVGKSTILNGILNEERAIVSEIPGTTRDTIEDTFIIEGVLYRFIDTAGIRATDDRIESIGIRKALEKISGASVVLFVTEAFLGSDVITGEVDEFRREILTGNSSLIVVINKSDMASAVHLESIGRDLEKIPDTSFIFMSAKESNDYIDLKKVITRTTERIPGMEGDVIITNSRHYEALLRVSEAADRIASGLNDCLPGDLIAVDVRQAIHYLGEITGDITSDEVLANIFRNFCIGK